MRERLQARLAELGEELERGQAMLRENELQRAQLEQSVMRIDGAMQVLRELLAEEGGPPPGEAEGRGSAGR
jgi:hypothetical protein